MALMSDIVNDALVEMRFGAGQDVQIHLQEGLVSNISRLYRTLMKKHVFRDYVTMTPVVISDVTGQPTTPVTAYLDKFSNLLAVFNEFDTVPLPVAPVGTNPARLRRPVVLSSVAAPYFTIYPLNQTRNVILLTRKYQEANFDMDDDVPFYRDILALGAAMMLSIKAGINDQLTKSLQQQFTETLDLYVVSEMQSLYQTNIQSGQYPQEWYTNE